jgi:hypothetical protein
MPGAAGRRLPLVPLLMILPRTETVVEAQSTCGRSASTTWAQLRNTAFSNGEGGSPDSSSNGAACIDDNGGTELVDLFACVDFGGVGAANENWAVDDNGHLFSQANPSACLTTNSTACSCASIGHACICRCGVRA